MKTIELDEFPQADFHPGVHTFVSMAYPIARAYAREKNKRRIGLKIFRKKATNLEDFKWKNHNVLECTKVQNLFAMHGLAPRVFDIVKLKTPKGRYWAQVTEIVEKDELGKREKGVCDEFNRLKSVYGIGVDSIDPNPHHEYKKMYVDFSHMFFKGEKYKQYLISLVKGKAGWGSNPAVYQSVPELGIVGQRNLERRLEVYKFDEIDFVNKTVLVYGASGGSICRELDRRGARRVVGLELPHVFMVGAQLCNYLGYFNIDMYGDNFSHKVRGNDVYKKIVGCSGLKQFDYVMYLSCQQLGMPDYLDKVCKEGFYLEGHSGDHDYTYRDDLREEFEEVIHLGSTHDHGVRPVFKCLNPK